MARGYFKGYRSWSWFLLFVFYPSCCFTLWPARRRTAATSATVASYLFYGWANPAFFLMLFSTAVDYICGLVMTKNSRDADGNIFALSREQTQQQPAYCSLRLILTNLGLLSFFKYFNFGMDSWNGLMSGLGFDGATYDNFLRITLPLGIDFYTFQSVYSIDIFL